MTATPAGNDPFTDVSVDAGVLRATAELVELLRDFLTDAEPAVRTQLGRYLTTGQSEENTTDPTAEALIVLQELDEAADLLHDLAGDTDTTA